MNFLLSVFKRTHDPLPRAAVDKLLKKLQVNSSDALPEYYCQVLMEPTSKQFKPRQIFKELLTFIPLMRSAGPLVKLFTLIFALIRNYCYPEYFLSQLQAVEELKCSKALQESSQSWIKELSICCITYLGRIYSLSDVYYRALQFKNLDIQDQTMQTDLFRLVNAYRLLFPTLNKVTNCIGRYFKEQHQYYQEFYRIMRGEIILGYNYMKHICNRFMNHYQKIDITIIKLLNCMISEIEILGDQIQEFLLNKYYKEKFMGPKLYFKEEDIQQLSFYLSRVNHEEQKYEDMLRTADSQFFAEAKLSINADDFNH